jgi:hypothetical protein
VAVSHEVKQKLDYSWWAIRCVLEELISRTLLLHRNVRGPEIQAEFVSCHFSVGFK